MSAESRYEEKYLINHNQYIIIKNRLKSLIHVDNYAKKSGIGGYAIRSIYFDDYVKSGVYDKIQGIKDRYKYRIRYYNLNKNDVKLEKKIKHNETGFKRSCPLSEEELNGLLSGDYAIVNKREDALIHEFVFQMKTKQLKPCLVVDYFREPYTYPINNIRITFDMNIKYEDKNFHIGDMNDRAPITDLIVLEVKYNNFLPKHIKRTLGLETISKMSFSKYVLSYLHSKGEDYIW